MNLKDLLFSFRGRITRLQYFGGSLVLAVLAGLTTICWLLGVAMVLYSSTFAVFWLLELLVLTPALGIGTVWVAYALAVKRMHDRDRDWYFVLVGFLPLVGPIWLFVELQCLKGTVGPNRFGPDPLA